MSAPGDALKCNYMVVPADHQGHKVKNRNSAQRTPRNSQHVNGKDRAQEQVHNKMKHRQMEL